MAFGMKRNLLKWKIVSFFPFIRRAALALPLPRSRFEQLKTSWVELSHHGQMPKSIPLKIHKISRFFLFLPLRVGDLHILLSKLNTYTMPSPQPPPLAIAIGDGYKCHSVMPILRRFWLLAFTSSLWHSNQKLMLSEPAIMVEVKWADFPGNSRFCNCANWVYKPVRCFGECQPWPARLTLKHREKGGKAKKRIRRNNKKAFLNHHKKRDRSGGSSLRTLVKSISSEGLLIYRTV